MTNEEYLLARIQILEDVIENFGHVVAANLPTITPGLNEIGRNWTQMIQDLDEKRKGEQQ